jgi:hypothetical protein
MNCFFRLAGGWHGRERCGFQAFQKSGPRLRTDDSGNCVSSALIVTGCCKPSLAGVRSIPEFPGAKDFSRLLGNKARRPAVCGHSRAFQTDQACRIAYCGRSIPFTLGGDGRGDFGVLTRTPAKLDISAIADEIGILRILAHDSQYRAHHARDDWTHLPDRFST